MKTLTVGITYYNEKELLTACVNSLLNQESPPEEVLIYDDNSSFAASDYAPKDSRVRVIRGTANRGPSFGRNQILTEAKGDYLHFHDSDDWFQSDWCRKVRDAVAAETPDAVFTEVSSYIDEKLYRERVIGLDTLRPDSDLVKFCLQKIMLVPAGTFRTGLLRELGGYRLELWQSEDFDFHIRLAARKPKFVVIQEPLVNIRIRRESRSQNYAETREYALKALQLLSKELPSQYRSELAEAAAKVGSQLFQCAKVELASQAFQLSADLGGARYLHQSPFYRVVARRLGPMPAEWVGRVYRVVIPQKLRRIFR